MDIFSERPACREGLDEETGLYYYGARYYDAQTSVWLSVDKLTEKYQSLSAYSFSANNPVKFVDPDGKRIILSSNLTETQRNTILKTMQSLTDDKLYYDSKTNSIKIASLAESGTESKVSGTNLIRKINSSKRIVTLDMNNSEGAIPENRKAGMVAVASNRENAQNGKGSDAIINFNPETTEFINSLNNGKGGLIVLNPETGYGEMMGKSTDAVGLGHELIHVLHFFQGDADMDNKSSYRVNFGGDNIWEFNDSNEELRTVGILGVKSGDITGNDIRKEQGLNPRIVYDHKSGNPIK